MKHRLSVVLFMWLPLVLACSSAHDAPSASDEDPKTVAGAQAGSGADADQKSGKGAEERAPDEEQMAGDEQMADEEEPMAGEEQPTVAKPDEAFAPDANVFVWSTDPFNLEAGQERYLCFAKTLEEDLVIDGYSSNVDGFVHHLIFSRVTAPEPEGFAECDVAFRSSWDPIFISGAGSTKLEFPKDAGHQIKKGTQLLVQMHLLNVADTPVEGAVTINMRRSSVANPRPVSTYIIGTAAVELPPHQKTQVVGTCSPFQQVKLIAGFPHMHLLGASMHFEVGKSEAELKEVWKRDPFEFDDQRIEPLDVTLAPGEVTRVTCTFDNPMDQTVSYGESTRNEMCYFIGFAVDQPRQAACIEVLPPFVFGQ